MDEPTQYKYDVIQGRYQLTLLVIDIVFSGNTIISDVVPSKWYTAPMSDLNNYFFKLSNGNSKTIPKIIFYIHMGGKIRTCT